MAFAEVYLAQMTEGACVTVSLQSHYVTQFSPTLLRREPPPGGGLFDNPPFDLCTKFRFGSRAGEEEKTIEYRFFNEVTKNKESNELSVPKRTYNFIFTWDFAFAKSERARLSSIIVFFVPADRLYFRKFFRTSNARPYRKIVISLHIRRGALCAPACIQKISSIHHVSN